jgi:zinc transporter
MERDADSGAAGAEAAGEVVHAGAAGPEGARWRWVHLSRSAATEAALRADPEVPEELADALLEPDTLPRVHTIEGDTVVILRGVNHAEGAEPEDMLSLRLAVSRARVLSIEIERLRPVERMIRRFREGRAPESPGAFVTELVEALRLDVEPVLDELEADVTALERRMLARRERLDEDDRARLVDTRQDAIQLNRYVSPQSEALGTLVTLRPDWLTSARRLRAEAHAFGRIASDLQSVRDRARLVAEEASLAITERTNRIILLLSAVSVVFLPITALTGLLGVNLAGIPYADAPWAFWAFTGIVAAAAAFAAWLARRLLR